MRWESGKQTANPGSTQVSEITAKQIVVVRKQKNIQKSVAMPSIQKPDRKLRGKAAPGKRKEQIDRSFLIDY